MSRIVMPIKVDLAIADFRCPGRTENETPAAYLERVTRTYESWLSTCLSAVVLVEDATPSNLA